MVQVQDWLYMDGEDANATEFQERLDSLKAIGSPISLRFVCCYLLILIEAKAFLKNILINHFAVLYLYRSDELTARPVAVEYGRKYLTEVKEVH